VQGKGAINGSWIETDAAQVLSEIMGERRDVVIRCENHRKFRCDRGAEGKKRQEGQEEVNDLCSKAKL